jgi:hypothetical protein
MGQGQAVIFHPVVCKEDHLPATLCCPSWPLPGFPPPAMPPPNPGSNELSADMWKQEGCLGPETRPGELLRVLWDRAQALQGQGTGLCGAEWDCPALAVSCVLTALASGCLVSGCYWLPPGATLSPAAEGEAWETRVATTSLVDFHMGGRRALAELSPCRGVVPTLSCVHALFRGVLA